MLISNVQKKQLLILPSAQNTLGGTLVTLSLMSKGFADCGMGDKLKILACSGSLLENYLKEKGSGKYLQIIQAGNQKEFLQKSLEFIHQQPKDFPLLLDNCVQREVVPTLTILTPKLRWSGRPVYFFFHDLSLSYNHLGYLGRKVFFSLLKPMAICNSHYTASHIKNFVSPVKGVLYQPVDLEKFNSNLSEKTPPEKLKPILDKGEKLILTPSRIKLSGDMNDKNLFALLPLLVELKRRGYKYHGVIVGEDKTPNQIASRSLQEEATKLGVADCFSILPPTFEIENYYKYADVVVTLAPREPFGRTVVEAIACGVPVVGSNTGGISEILNHFAPEWTVAPNDFKAAADTIINIANNPNSRNLIAQGQLWIKTECSLQGYARKIMEITQLTPTNELIYNEN
ncbi:glycosyltransferase [Phormidium sp. LEGE 05292]|uniref:glycosyltransferase n=1 Tax=[Phormidium] sp. LEGE 05292 TaxID=767427 RepID=UPI00187F2D99|nr:glycosyltransferase [Phormidium sp. LEGE 05292]MBE9226056.1 glycosyltransferase [Phormidium sp. LEGE 05292]